MRGPVVAFEMISFAPWTVLALLLTLLTQSARATSINREEVVRRFNPYRNQTSYETPMQVGNGDFAFGADITGLQTIVPWNILTTWCWHNSSLPTAPGQTSPSDFTGLEWWTHGHLVPYDQPNPAEADISQWLIANPHRVNLARIGFLLDGKNIDEANITNASQRLDLFSGSIYSNFTLHGVQVTVETVADPDSDTLAVQIQSGLLKNGTLSIFIDFPYATDANKFETFVGVWNETSRHSTYLSTGDQAALIEHVMDNTTYCARLGWQGNANISRPLQTSHKYILQPQGNTDFSFTATFSPIAQTSNSSFAAINKSSTSWWSSYWTTGAFVDLTPVANPNATELQRRTILSQYLLAVNSAGHLPPQESGLTNNGWYGKFHLEMVIWHLGHWTLWSKWDLLTRSMPSTYTRFLPTSLTRAAQQGYAGARWGKMSDPSGRSAPGEINSLLIWQQPHPLLLAELHYRASPTPETLEIWDPIVVATADFMASYAWPNPSTGVFDLGPPLYPVSENTNPNATTNPTFELAYWRLGLAIAARWQTRQNRTVPQLWRDVLENLAPLPIQNGTYVLYEGVQDPWTDTTLTTDHPAIVGIDGLLPPPPPPVFNASIFAATLDKVYETWDLDDSYGWDFPLLAMTAARRGDGGGAVAWLLDERFGFDEVGMPEGGGRVPTPYFPGAGGLVLAVGMMAGWGVWPVGWEGVRVEGMGRWV